MWYLDPRMKEWTMKVGRRPVENRESETTESLSVKNNPWPAMPLSVIIPVATGMQPAGFRPATATRSE
jgi:hypothetical protein